MASKKVDQVLTGIKALTATERTELVKLLSGEQYGGTKTTALNESLIKASSIYTAPIGGGGCACCGK